MTFVQRYTAPIFAKIPDTSEIPTGRLIGIGILISLLLHLVAFLMIPLFALFFKDRDVDFAKTPVKPREIELQVVPPEEEERIQPFTITPPERPFLDSRGLDIAPDPTKDPLFESDENMKAASERAATGDSLLPGQLGKQLPFNAFQNTRSLLGPAPEPFSPTPPSVQPLPAPPPPSVQVAQMPDPAPPADVPQDPTPPPPEAEKSEEQTPTKDKERTKPTEYKAVDKLLDEQIAIAKREFKPTAVTQIERPANTPSPVAHAAVLRPLDDQMAKLTTPAPKPQMRHESGYQPEQEKTRIESSISNRGKSAVDSIATPMGKYRKQVSDAIGSRWHYYVNDKMSLFAIGSVRISFSVDAQGHVSRIKVESNSSNQSLEDVSIQAIRDAELAPPPPNPALPSDQDPFEWTINFTYYHIQ